jgi:hypothetical protein
MANRYWVGGTGDWNGASTANWSTSSGGSSGASIPLATDNVFFDALSGGGTVTVRDTGPGNIPECANLTCTGFTGAIDSSAQALNVNGNVTLSTGGDYTLFYVNIVSGTVCTLTSVGKPIYQIDTESGSTLSLADDVNLTQSFGISLGIGGTFTTNNFNVTAYDILIFDTATINMGSSVFSILHNDPTGFGWGVDLGTINAGTSTINFLNSYSCNFAGGGKTYYNVNMGGSGQVVVSDNNTFNTFSTSVQPIVIFFNAGSTQTVTNFNVSGTAGNLVYLESINGGIGSQFTLSKSSGTVSSDYLYLRDSNATGGAAWYAGTHSTNVSNNSGWTFTAPPAGGGGGGTAVVNIGGGIKIGGGIIFS